MKFAAFSALAAVLSLASAAPQGLPIPFGSSSSSVSTTSRSSTTSTISSVSGRPTVSLNTTIPSLNTRLGLPTQVLNTTSARTSTTSVRLATGVSSSSIRLSTASPSAVNNVGTGAPFGNGTSTTSSSNATSTLRPSNRSQYSVWTGAIAFNTTQGKIFKNGKTSDITTLLTFNFPPATAGKTCEFHFNLAPDNAAIVTGSGQFDVFNSLKPATGSTTTWPPGNQRNQYLGRMQAVKTGEATVVPVAGVPGPSIQFKCPTGNQGFELVGVNDVDDIEWNALKGAGAYLRYF